MFHFDSDHGKSDSSTTTIQFENLEEILAWVQFVGYDSKTLKLENLRHTMHLRELLLVLGVDESEVDDGGTASTLRLVPGLARQERAPRSPRNTHSPFNFVFSRSPRLAGYKCNLLQLPSAWALRSALHAKLAAAIDVEPTLLTSTARIRNTIRSIATAIAPLNPRLTCTFDGHNSVVECVAVCADDKHIVSGSQNGAVMVWGATTGAVEISFTKHNYGVKYIALLPDGSRVASGGSRDSTVRIWRLDTGTDDQTFTEHSDVVNQVAVSPNGRSIASASRDCTIKMWSVDSASHRNMYIGYGIKSRCEATFTGHSSSVRCVAFSSNGQTLASGSDDSTIKVWSTSSRDLKRTINGHAGAVTGVEFTADGERLVSCSCDKRIKLWKWSTGELAATFEGHTDSVNSIAVFPDGNRVASGSEDGTVRIWNLRSKMLEHTFMKHANSVWSVAVSHDGSKLVSGSGDHKVMVRSLT